MDNYPDEYNKVVTAKISKVWLEAAQDDKRITQSILGSLNKLSDSEKLVLLGKNANKKITSLLDLSNKVEDKVKLGEYLGKVYRESNTIQERSKSFADAFVQKLKARPESELNTIFGPDGIEKFKALVTIDKFKNDMANPSKTALNWSLWDKNMWASTIAEFKRNKAYKAVTKIPENVGETRKNIGKKLMTPGAFGKSETVRAILTTPTTKVQE
jgi:hypothetical protein